MRLRPIVMGKDLVSSMADNEPRNHHYIPQCYLKGFGWKHKKHWYTNVAFGTTEKWHEWNLRDVGAERDFLRIDVPGHDPNAIESAMANIEGEIATALRNINQTEKFEGDDRNMIIHLMALLAVRSPARREHWRQLQAHTQRVVMDLALSSKAMWESQKRQMKEAGQEICENVTYKQMKRYNDREEHETDVPRERHIETEFHVFDTVLQALRRRNWSLYVTNEGLGPFVSSDHPVVLSWLNPPSAPRWMGNSPGYALKNTQVYFPISHRLALTGEFDGEDCTLPAIPEVVGLGNVQMIENCNAQLFASKKDFLYYGPTLELHQDSLFMERFGAAKKVRDSTVSNP